MKVCPCLSYCLLKDFYQQKECLTEWQMLPKQEACVFLKSVIAQLILEGCEGQWAVLATGIAHLSSGFSKRNEWRLRTGKHTFEGGSACQTGSQGKQSL